MHVGVSGEQRGLQDSTSSLRFQSPPPPSLCLPLSTPPLCLISLPPLRSYQAFLFLTGFYLFPFPFVLPAGPHSLFPSSLFVSHNFLLSVSSFLPSRIECFLFPTLLKYLEPICFLLFCCLFPPTVLRPRACVCDQPGRCL